MSIFKNKHRNILKNDKSFVFDNCFPKNFADIKNFIILHRCIVVQILKKYTFIKCQCRISRRG